MRQTISTIRPVRHWPGVAWLGGDDNGFCTGEFGKVFCENSLYGAASIYALDRCDDVLGGELPPISMQV